MAKRKTQNKPTTHTVTVDDFRKAAQAGKALRGVLFRDIPVGAVDEEKRTVELAFSSEIPVDRGWIIEILDHGKGSVDTSWISSGRAPLLADHDPSIHIGVIESADIGKDRVGRAVVRFGKSAQADAYFKDVVDGIRTSISVGYSIEHVILEEETDAGAIYRVMKWKPLEISLVSIPADQTVGIGRSEGDEGEEIPQPTQTTQPTTEKRNMSTPENSAANPTTAQPDPAVARTAWEKENATRTNEIMALAKRHNMVDAGVEFVTSGKSVDDFRAHVLEKIGAPKPVDPASSNILGLNDKEARQYSFLRAIRALVFPDNVQYHKEAAFEREVSDAVQAKFKGRKFRGNIQIPTEVLVAGMIAAQGKRDLNVTTGSQGGYLVANELQPASFIELLRNRLLLRELGARVLTGLEGNLSIPKQSGGATAYWVTEGGDVTESQQALGQVSLTPKTVGAFTEMTRRMILQSSLDMENFVREDLAKVLAIAVDKAGLKGSGSGGEPLGILNTTGIGTVLITTHTFTDAKMIDLESEVAADNADLGTLAYLACAADRGRMKKADIGTDTGKRVWTSVPGQPGVGEVNGYRAFATNQLAEDEVLFGNFADVIIGEWGVLDILVNPYAKDTSGGVRITALQDVDVAVRHPESFAKTTV